MIVSPATALCHRPQTVGDIINQTVGKVLDLFRVPHDLFCR
jgi:4-hydroxy-3-polyprenylbenzoate decarboxylase